MSDLIPHAFADLYEMSSGISTSAAQAGHGSPFLSFSTVFNNHFVPDVLPDLMDTSESEQMTYSIRKGDVFLTRTSETVDELGMSCVALRDHSNATYSGFLKRLRPKKQGATDPKFMAFYLRSPMFRKAMTNNAVMVLRASLNENIFSYLKLLLPDFDSQTRIGDFLHLLTAKIDINNRINVELEALAKTIYDYWFVQFDFPDAEGRPYKTSGGKMVYSDALKREVPAGWEAGKLGDALRLEYGKPLKDSDRTGSGFPVMGSNGVVGFHDAYLVSGPGVIVGRKGTAGAVNYSDENFFPIDTTYYVLTKRDYGIFFCYHLLESLPLSRLNSDSAVPGLNRETAHRIPVVLPPTELVTRFESCTHAFGGRRRQSLVENRELTQLRDWLLPLLMNGQVRVQ